MSKFIFISILSVFTFVGCKTYDNNDNNSINNINQQYHVPSSSFSDEYYIWESWYFSTNTVQEAK